MKPETKCDLWKLGFLSAEMIQEADLDKKHLPDDVFCRGSDYYRIENKEIDPEELELFLKVKNAHNLNLIRLSVVACAVFLGIFAVCAFLAWVRG